MPNPALKRDGAKARRSLAPRWCLIVIGALGKVGLAFLALLGCVGIYAAVEQRDWWGVLACSFFAVVVLSYYDVFRTALRRLMSHVRFRASRTVSATLFVVLGFAGGAKGIASVVGGAPFGGTAMTLIGTYLVWCGVNVYRGRT